MSQAIKKSPILSLEMIDGIGCVTQCIIKNMDVVGCQSENDAK